MHPFTAANMVATLGHLYGRRLYLNLVAGGFRNDLLALNDPTPHDERYERTRVYAQLITRLLAGETVTFSGPYYSVTNLRLAAPLTAELQPGLLMSGSSPAGLATAREIGALAVKYPKRPSDESPQAGENSGVRVGIVARPGLGRRMAGGARSVSRGPQGPAHPEARDEGIGLALASPTRGDERDGG